MSKHAFFSWAVVLAATFLFAIQQQTLAQSTTYSISTLSGWDGYIGITGFSDARNNTGLVSYGSVGENFRINNGNALITSIAFPVWASAPLYVPGPSDFQVGVTAWNGTRPTGPLLYLSDHLVAYDGWQNFDVTPNNLILNQGQQYLLFFTSINYIDDLTSVSSMGYVPGNPYADGEYFTFGWGGYDVGINDLFTHNWTQGNADMAFQINYQIVPEPAATVLLGLGSVLLIFRRKFLPG